MSVQSNRKRAIGDRSQMMSLTGLPTGNLKFGLFDTRNEMDWQFFSVKENINFDKI